MAGKAPPSPPHPMAAISALLALLVIPAGGPTKAGKACTFPAAAPLPRTAKTGRRQQQPRPNLMPRCRHRRKATAQRSSPPLDGRLPAKVGPPPEPKELSPPTPRRAGPPGAPLHRSRRRPPVPRLSFPAAGRNARHSPPDQNQPSAESAAAAPAAGAAAQRRGQGHRRRRRGPPPTHPPTN